jgi:catechol 2,3-dioxygenase
VQGLLATVAHAEPEPERRAGPGLRMGHVHLHVGDIDAAREFYCDVLGFEPMTTYPGAIFVAAGGYHHHVGLNTWRGEGVGPAPEAAVGLREWTIVVDPDALATVRGRLGSDLVADPWEISVRFVSA